MIFTLFLGSITKLPKLKAAEWKSSNGLSVQVKCLGKIYFQGMHEIKNGVNMQTYITSR